MGKTTGNQDENGHDMVRTRLQQKVERDHEPIMKNRPSEGGSLFDSFFLDGPDVFELYL